MDQKPRAGIATTAMVAPLLVLCCLGPVVVASIVGGILGWLGSLGPAKIIGAAVLLGAVAYGLCQSKSAMS